MTLTPAPGDQRMKDTLDIDAVRLHPPRSAIDPQAGRFHHQARDAPLLEEASQPEAVVAGLVAQRHLRRLARSLSHRAPVPHRASPSALRHRRP